MSFERNGSSRARLMCLAGVLAGGVLMPARAAEPSAPAPKPATVKVKSPYRPDRFAGRAGKYYQLIWGIDSLSVRLAESGQIVRFSYRVLDPAKARALNDKRNEPALIDPRAGVQLVVPKMEKGDRVDVVIGQFRAQNLVVD